MSVTGNPHLSRQSVPAGSFVFVEGDQESHFYIVEEGEIEIFTMIEGKMIPIVKCGAGESFGEFAMLVEAPRTASARAKTDCVLVKVSRQGFEELLNQLPGWANTMIKSFAHRLTNMNDVLKKSPQFFKS